MSEKVNMIDISSKPPVKRTATAQGEIFLKADTIQKIKDGQIKKGDPITIGEVAAMTAIKSTPQLIPLCHQIPITHIDFSHEFREDRILVSVSVSSIAQTGVEMEALIGVSIFLNNIWDMTKYLEKDEIGQYPTTQISNIRVVKKEKS